MISLFKAAVGGLTGVCRGYGHSQGNVRQLRSSFSCLVHVTFIYLTVYSSGYPRQCYRLILIAYNLFRDMLDIWLNHILM